MNQGWIKLHRSLLEWEWFDDHNTFRLFMYLMLKANHNNKKWRGLELPAGSIVTGQDILALEVGLTRMQVRTSLDKLKTTREITIKTNNKGSIIQIVNYKKYQVVTSKQPTDNQQITTNNNIKNDNKYIPTLQEFATYALELKPTLDRMAVEAKYQSWIENDWKDGHDKQIKNWKTKLRATIPYMKETKSNYSEPLN